MTMREKSRRSSAVTSGVRTHRRSQKLDLLLLRKDPHDDLRVRVQRERCLRAQQEVRLDRPRIEVRGIGT